MTKKLYKEKIKIKKYDSKDKLISGNKNLKEEPSKEEHLINSKSIANASIKKDEKKLTNDKTMISRFNLEEDSKKSRISELS